MLVSSYNCWQDHQISLCLKKFKEVLVILHLRQPFKKKEDIGINSTWFFETSKPSRVTNKESSVVDLVHMTKQEQTSFFKRTLTPRKKVKLCLFNSPLTVQRWTGVRRHWPTLYLQALLFCSLSDRGRRWGVFRLCLGISNVKELVDDWHIAMASQNMIVSTSFYHSWGGD